MEKKNGQKRARQKDPRKQVRVAEDATSREAKEGNKAFMKQMMEYQFDED